MGRPSGGYKLDGERIPGVTTIAGLLKDAAPLMWWSWDCGMKGLDYRQVRDDAASAGTCLHDMIEEDWHGKPFDRSKYDEAMLAKADHAFLSYLAWKSQTNLKVVKAEVSLVSRKHRFGGTMDCLLVGGELTIGDWKSSSHVYPEMLIQVAGGYSLLYEEAYPDDPPLTGMHLLRFSKPKDPNDPISFSAHYWSAEIFPIAQRQFLLLREAYDLQKRLKGLV